MEQELLSKKELLERYGISYGALYRWKRKGLIPEDWFADSIGKIQYLFPKAHGVTYVKLAATLMWYKIYYPKEFNEIML